MASGGVRGGGASAGPGPPQGPTPPAPVNPKGPGARHPPQTSGYPWGWGWHGAPPVTPTCPPMQGAEPTERLCAPCQLLPPSMGLRAPPISQHVVGALGSLPSMPGLQPAPNTGCGGSQGPARGGGYTPTPSWALQGGGTEVGPVAGGAWALAPGRLL
ncbi:hypothetical protein KIL84_001538 [Mauremys mutica]|uniref:Uncharacterized protein n=1 Tax=Mauremys mutica TaxID=74926 RepID=A0A9D3XHE3_9SAUR|nr:hypothetical protein KIL84_001538 [Mauremys mutica]